MAFYNSIIFFTLLDFLAMLVPLLVAIAYLTLLERKLMAIVQKRRGPNLVGVVGILQPLADGVKLLLKDTLLPLNINKLIFILSPIVGFLLSLFNWILIPFTEDYHLYNMENNLFFIFAIMSLNVYGVILGGWSSNSKYALLGSIRAVSQMLSYEVILFFSLFPLILLSGSLNVAEIVIRQSEIWFIFILPISSIIFFIAILAETNRTPFDLPEAEGELVAGYNVEFSSMVFALFFLAEYSNILLVSALFSLLFLGGWQLFGISSPLIFSTKIVLIASLFIIVRAILPRYRYDQLIEIGWQVILPLTFSYFLLILFYKICI